MWRCEESSSGWSGIRGDSIKSNPETARAQVSSVNQDSTDSERPAQLEATDYWVLGTGFTAGNVTERLLAEIIYQNKIGFN